MKFADPISRTSQAVALTRARLDRPHSPDGDPQAQVFDAAELEASAPAGQTLLVEASPVRDR